MTTKTTNLNIRLTAAEKLLIERAAKRAQRTPSDWSRLVLLAAAKKALK